ncbi:MAG: CpaD family pilus assembly protein [Roseitalea sp.]|jgi:pilus assembly protein CpaD|nr:CpaD family pilus assembly protein [Roseitalea sp.]MBO6722914.1 CpaD family pilus assembly protein [Roseitalea sp.]MBO6745052.1 CpaD family pilus assembly protein [Roseitalea sp.]
MSLKHLQTVGGLVIAAGLLAGCATGTDDIAVSSVSEDYRTNHPIIVSESEQTLDIAVASGARTLNAATQSNVTAFARAFDQSGTGVLHLMLPSNSPNEHAADRVRDSILHAIERGGASRNDVSVQHYDASGHGVTAPVRLSYSGVTAGVPRPCGQWTENLVDTMQNRHYGDFGCSSQNNLAAQIENPNDLLGPRAMSPIDAIQRGAVIDTYQSGPAAKTSEVNY